MKEYFWKRSLIFMGCFIYLNACQAPNVHAIDEEEKDIPSFTREEMLAGGGERCYLRSGRSGRTPRENPSRRVNWIFSIQDGGKGHGGSFPFFA